MSDILMMDLSQLEADELAYEERIRAHYAPPRNHLMLSSLGILMDGRRTCSSNRSIDFGSWFGT